MVVKDKANPIGKMRDILKDQNGILFTSDLLEYGIPRTYLSILEKKGEGIHHLAFAVENADNALNEAKELGLELIDKQSRKGAEGLNIGFLHPKSTKGILVEFCSK